MKKKYGEGASKKINGGSKMNNSNLVNCTVKSPNHSGTRTHSIDRITPHCVVGQLSAESIGECFTNPSRQASCNYGIGLDGRVCLIVDECNRSWSSSSNANDQRAVTIEVASDSTAPYAFKDAAYNKLIDLCADICKRNGKNVLLWIDNKDKALAYEPKSNEMVLTVHRWFANKSCPGDWMYARMGDLASKVTAKLGGSNAPATPIQPEPIKPTPVTLSTGFTDGQVIQLKPGSTYYNGKAIPQWVFGSTLYYRGQNSDGIIFSTQKTGAITGVVKPSAIITSNAPTASTSYLVKVTADALNIRKGPGTNYAIVGCITDKGSYTIVEENNGWGKLKSDAGWINLNYTKKC